MTISNDRETKYTTAVREAIAVCGHATNAELLETVQRTYPQVSATTIHRITSRLCERGELQLAPSGRENALRYDANLTPHDHFMCNECGLMRDAQLGDVVRPEIEAAIGDGCSLSGSLTVSGLCRRCAAQR